MLWKVETPWCHYIVRAPDGLIALDLVRKTYAAIDECKMKLVGPVESDDPGDPEVVGVSW